MKFEKSGPTIELKQYEDGVYKMPSAEEGKKLKYKTKEEYANLVKEILYFCRKKGVL